MSAHRAGALLGGEYHPGYYKKVLKKISAHLIPYNLFEILKMRKHESENHPNH